MIQMAEIKLTDNEINAAVKVLRSGALRQGRQCETFETEFAEKVGAKFAVTCASGTAALHLAYLSFLQPGDEVLVPSLTFIATASMISICGGVPIFCDVDPETFLIDLKNAEKKVTSKTKAIAPVHLYGNPCNIDEVTAFARKYDLKIIWDAAQAHGALFNKQDIGSFNDFVCYSFYPSKNMFVGEGGMVCINDPDMYYKLRYLRTHGQTEKYYHTMLGLNYRMTDVEAAIGREQLKRLDEMLLVRRRNAKFYDEAFSDIEGITPQKVTSKSKHAYHQYCIVIDKDKTGISRDDLAKRLNEHGIGTGIHYPRGLHQQPIFKELYNDEASYPITEYLTSNILALPVHHGLDTDDLQYIIKCLKSSL